MAVAVHSCKSLWRYHNYDAFFYITRYGQGVILGTEETPMRNVVFDGVRVINAQDDTVASYLKCEGVQDAVATGDTYPVPPCFQDRTKKDF